jgi:F0F1-type ATP synthase assembly protein I
LPDNKSVSPSTPPPHKEPKSESRQFAVALELPFILVSAIVIGGLLGYLLDRWLHIRPIMTLILGGLGFYAGLRDVLKRVSKDTNGDA